jgi:hypothetical protein
MRCDSSPDPASLTPGQLLEVNRVCDRFENDLRAGRRPTIENVLTHVAEPLQTALLRDLLNIELEYRRALGERPGMAEYRRRFPDHAGMIEAHFPPSESSPKATGSATPATSADVARNLLFGVLALQNGLIDAAHLVAAFQAWLRDPRRPLADHLARSGCLDPEDRRAVEVLVARQLIKLGVVQDPGTGP